MRAKSHPFHKIPPELAYLEKRNRTLDPKPIDKPAPPPSARPSTTTPVSSYLPPLSKLKFLISSIYLYKIVKLNFISNIVKLIYHLLMIQS